jgi:hypothetical protein
MTYYQRLQIRRLNPCLCALRIEGVLHRGKVFGSDDDGLSKRGQTPDRGPVRKLKPSTIDYPRTDISAAFNSTKVSQLLLSVNSFSNRVSYCTEMLWRAEE